MDSIDGVSEHIILGMQASIGTGLFKLVHNHNEITLDQVTKTIFEEHLA